MTDQTNLDGKLLIAMPGIGDDNFDKSVIYMCSHTPEGAMGLIINKPAPDLALKDLLEQLAITPSQPIELDSIHIGGPVEHGRGFVLHSRDYVAKEATMDVTDTVGMTASLEILEDISNGNGPDQCLLALGYSGWAPGQLENEIQANGWLIGDASDDLLFETDDDAKWDAALKGLGIDARMLSAEGGRA
jgi:putative transcriptional regulator